MERDRPDDGDDDRDDFGVTAAEERAAGERAGERALHRPELRPVWQAVHDRLSTGRPVTRVRPGPLDEDQREALADLLGLDRLPDVRPSVPLSRLEEAVQEAAQEAVAAVAVQEVVPEGDGHALRQFVIDLIGPLGDRAADRRRHEEARAELWTWLAGHDTVRAQPALGAWAAACRSAGLVNGSLQGTRALLANALAVLAALPAAGQPLPSFAAQVVRGDAHALDDGTRLSSLVLRALATLHDLEPPQSAQDRRSLWARAGVSDDELSSTVLAAGLRLDGDGLIVRMNRMCADAGQAASLTLAQLRTQDQLAEDGRARVQPSAPVVHVVENPSVMAMALRRFGPACPPLVCTSGWPNSAAIHLLRLLADRGAVLRYHGDFDGEGIRIAAYVLDKTPALPWRMSADDYCAAVAHTPHGPLPGRLTEAPWDTELTPAIARHGRAVVEELVTDVLLADLSSFAYEAVR